jgi:hypothetical protein
MTGWWGYGYFRSSQKNRNKSKKVASLCECAQSEKNQTPIQVAPAYKAYNHHSQNNWREMSYWLFITKNQQWHLWIEIILLVAWMIMNHACLKCNLTSTAFSEALWNASDIIVGCSPLLSKLRHCFSKAPAKTTTAQPKYSSTFSHHARTFIVDFTLDKHCQITNGPWV